MEIYVLINNQPQGPYTPELIRQHLKSGQLKPSDVAAYAGSADWKPLSVMVQSWAPGQRGRGAAPSSGVRRKPSKASPVLAVVVVAVLLLAGAVGFYWWRTSNSGGSVVAVTTPYEAGLPNSLTELNAWYVEPPPGQNAATFYLKAFDALQISEAEHNSIDLPLIGKGALPPLGSPLSVATRNAIGQLVARNTSVLQAVQQGFQLEQSRYPIDLTRGYEALLPHLSKLRQTARFEALFGLVKADAKQADAAAEANLKILALGSSVNLEPTLISQLVRVACVGIEKDNLERLVNSVALPSSALDRLSAALAKAESDEAAGIGFTRAFVAERVTSLALFDLPQDKLRAALKTFSAGGDRGASNVPDLEEVIKSLKAQRSFAEETFNHVLAIRKLSFPDRLKVNDYAASRVAIAQKNGFRLYLMVLPALSKATSREAIGLADLRLARTAVALEQFRATNNRYPASLNELTPNFLPSVPQDPFDGEPLRYAKNGDGYELHSIGADPAKPITFKVIKPVK